MDEGIERLVKVMMAISIIAIFLRDLLEAYKISDGALSAERMLASATKVETWPRSHPGYSIFLHGIAPPPLVGIEKRQLNAEKPAGISDRTIEELLKVKLLPFTHQTGPRGMPIVLRATNHQLIYEAQSGEYYEETHFLLRRRLHENCNNALLQRKPHENCNDAVHS
jgi:hypothetical protein